VIEFHNVHKTYRVAGKDIPALHSTSLRVESGQVFGLIGHSGAGKSTLLRLINRLETPSGGQIIVDNEDVTAMDANGLRRFRQQVGMIFPALQPAGLQDRGGQRRDASDAGR
jgi:D-methionine transport system ATP-binding protein